MVGLCDTLCLSEFSPANQILFGQDLPNFNNKEELLEICKFFLNDEDQYIKAKNIFVKKCFEYEDHDYFKNILQTIMKKKIHKKNLTYSMPYWYIRVFFNQKIRNISKRSNLLVYIKEMGEILLFKINKNKLFQIPIILENLVKFPFIIIKILINKFVR